MGVYPRIKLVGGEYDGTYYSIIFLRVNNRQNFKIHFESRPIITRYLANEKSLMDKLTHEFVNEWQDHKLDEKPPWFDTMAIIYQQYKKRVYRSRT